MTMDGYAGKVADIDLTRNRVTIATTLSDWKKRYLGGRGFGARVVTDRVDPHDDPLGGG